MSTAKIPLEQIEQGRVLRQLIQWFKISPPSFPTRFNALRSRSRHAAERAGIRPADINRLIADVRSRRAKT